MATPIILSARRVHSSDIDNNETGSGSLSEDNVNDEEVEDIEEGEVLYNDVPIVSIISGTPVNERKLFYYHVAKTVTCVCVSIWVGVMHTSFSTCLLDIEERLHVSLEQIGKLMSAITAIGVAGHLAGAVFSEYLRFNELLLLSVFTLTNAVACLVRAWASSMIMLGIGGCLDSFCNGVISTVCHPMLMGIWQGRASSPIHAIHFGWSFGSLIAPLLTKPFLSIPCPSDDPDVMTSNSNHSHISGKTMTEGQLHNLNQPKQLANCSLANVTNQTMFIRESSIEIPLSIPAIPLFIVAMAFLSFFIFERTSRGKAWRTVRTDAKKTMKWCQYDTSSGISFRFTVVITSLVTYFYSLWVGISAILGTFLFTLTVKLPLGFTKDDAAVAYSVFYICFSSGRFLAIAIAHYVSIKKMLPIEVCGTLLTVIGWVLLGLKSRGFYWFFMCLFGMISAPVWPGGFTWINRYIVATAVTFAIIEVGVGVGSTLYTWIAGKLIGEDEPRYFLYVVLGLTVHLVLILIILMCLVRKRVDRHMQKGGHGLTDIPVDEVEEKTPVKHEQRNA